MKTYDYTALAEDGTSTSGRAWAVSELDLDRELERGGLTLTTFKLVASERSLRKLKLKRDELINVTNQLSTVTGAGIRLVEGLEGIGARLQTESGRALVEQMVAGLRSGQSLSEVMERHPNCFPEVYRASIRAGEASGALDLVLRRLAAFLEWARAMRSTTIQALTYPAILFVALTGLVLVLLNFVLPRIVGMFPGGEENLPSETRAVLAISKFIRGNWLLLVVGGVGLVVAFKVITKKPKGRELWHRFLIRIPKFGNVVRAIATSKFASTASTLQQAGCDVFTTLGTASATCGNAAIGACFDRTIDGVHQGLTITQGLEREELIDPLLTQMVSVGEKTGELDNCLARLSEYYDEEIPRVVKKFMGVFEPAMLFAAAGVVMFILLAALMPLFKMYETMGG